MAQDPGLGYLYKHPGPSGSSAAAKGGGPQPGKRADPNTSHQQAEAALAMNYLARDPLHTPSGAAVDWGACMGNLQNAKLAAESLRALVADAVFLDEEAFSHAATLQLYQQRLQVR